jgi:glycosyltransferase involved in cell wall biosynthesis
VLLFLSRVHPKKGLPSLLQAWAEVGDAAKDWALVIAGPDEKRHAAQLDTMIQNLALQHSVTIVGPLFGAAKRQAFLNATACVLPSLSEGVPVAIQEAWAYGLPVLITKHCNLSREARQGAAIETEADASSLAAGLRALFSLNSDERRSMGSIGRRIAESRFSWSTCGRQMLDVCDWLTNGGTRPEVVRID